MISVSIPGKIHLIGEHTSVYGKGAILASINLYLHAKISKSKEKEVSGLVQYDDAIKNMQSAIEQKIKDKFDIKKIPNYKIEIDKSGITVGSGLGTSASLSVAFSECLLKFLKIEYSKDDLFEIAFEGEKIFHGNPSGGDLSAVLNQGLTYFKKSLDNTKIIRTIQINQDINFLLIDSGKPEESTSEMVSLVSLRGVKRRGNLDEILNSQEILTNRLLNVLKDWDESKFSSIVKSAQGNLEKLGVVGEDATKIIRQIESLNGAAKITGAGGIKKGSGMILAYHKDLKSLIRFAKVNHLKYYPVEISYEGVKYK